MCVKVTHDKKCETCGNIVSSIVTERPCYKAREKDGYFGCCGIIDRIDVSDPVECDECEKKRKAKEA
ncbi:unnamed protein product [Fusarium graminearum]|nr:unnamed protein product [Fusarium graminearum]CAF3646808.1 unnamed protein product [Fusarium graminearum]VTO83005.1 unnamed protein product [Fusarium graminearum]